MFVPSIVAYIWGNMFKIVFEGKNPYFDSKFLFPNYTSNNSGFTYKKG